MSIFGRKREAGIMDVIRCDEDSCLIWKWHPAETVSGGSSRENSIRWGSSLHVRDGEVAVFVYGHNKENAQDYFEGPCDVLLRTANLPVLSGILGLAYHGDTPFQAEVYFINVAQLNQVRFGVPFFDIFDPRFPDFGVPVTVRGTISFRIERFRDFIRLHRLADFSPADFQRQIRDAVCRYVKDVTANAPAEHNIPVVQIETKTAPINDAIEYYLTVRLQEDFGVTVSGVDLEAIEIDKESEGYARLMAVTRDITAASVQAQAEADRENYVETLRIQREESQYAQRKQTQSSNMAPFQIEKQAEVGTASAGALGQIGRSGAGNVNLGGAGFHPAAAAAEMAVGSAVGRNLADTLNGMTAAAAGGGPVPDGAVPPPVPQIVYHLAKNGKAVGPFTIDALRKMAQAGQITSATLVWKPGMSKWAKAGTTAELSFVHANSLHG